MPFATWLAELRRLLLQETSPDPAGWSDENARRYYDGGFTPASALAELRFRELAGS